MAAAHAGASVTTSPPVIASPSVTASPPLTTTWGAIIAAAAASHDRAVRSTPGRGLVCTRLRPIPPPVHLPPLVRVPTLIRLRPIAPLFSFWPIAPIVRVQPLVRLPLVGGGGLGQSAGGLGGGFGQSVGGGGGGIGQSATSMTATQPALASAAQPTFTSAAAALSSGSPLLARPPLQPAGPPTQPAADVCAWPHRPLPQVDGAGSGAEEAEESPAGRAGEPCGQEMAADAWVTGDAWVHQSFEQDPSGQRTVRRFDCRLDPLPIRSLDQSVGHLIHYGQGAGVCIRPVEPRAQPVDTLDRGRCNRWTQPWMQLLDARVHRSLPQVDGGGEEEGEGEEAWAHRTVPLLDKSQCVEEAEARRCTAPQTPCETGGQDRARPGSTRCQTGRGPEGDGRREDPKPGALPTEVGTSAKAGGGAASSTAGSRPGPLNASAASGFVSDDSERQRLVIAMQARMAKLAQFNRSGDEPREADWGSDQRAAEPARDDLGHQAVVRSWDHGTSGTGSSSGGPNSSSGGGFSNDRGQTTHGSVQDPCGARLLNFTSVAPMTLHAPAQPTLHARPAVPAPPVNVSWTGLAELHTHTHTHTLKATRARARLVGVWWVY